MRSYGRRRAQWLRLQVAGRRVLCYARALRRTRGRECMVLRGRASHLVRPPASGWCTLFGPSQHGRRTAWRPWSLLASLCRRSQHLSSLRGRRWARVCMHACSRDVWVESVPSVCASVAQLTSPLFAACGCGLACCTPSFRPHSHKTVVFIWTPVTPSCAAILRVPFRPRESLNT